MFVHQDWNRVVITHTPKLGRGERGLSEAMRRGQEVQVVRKQNANAQRQAPNIRKLAEETDVVQLITVGHEFAQIMQKARADQGLKQQDLAHHISEKLSVVKDYESGRAVPSAAVILKIERALNVRLPRHKAGSEES